MNPATPDDIHALRERGSLAQAQEAAMAALNTLSGAERGDMLLALGKLHSAMGHTLEALRAAVQADEVFKAVGHRGGECRALTVMGQTLRSAGDHALAIATLEQAEVLARVIGDQREVARVLRALGVCCSLVGRHQHALSCLADATQLAAVHGDVADQLGLRMSLLNALSRQADTLVQSPEERTVLLNQLLAEWPHIVADAAAAESRTIEVMASGNLAITLSQAGRPAEAAVALQALLPQYRALGLRPNEGLCISILARCHLELGRFESARECSQQAIALLGDGGALDDLRDACEILSQAEEALGRDGAALDALKQVRDIERRKSDAAARAAVVQRELRIELARLTNQWARQATQDPLTSLGNRRALDLWMAEHLPRAGQGEALTVLLMDLDHFKRVNDSFGHAIGDEVLRWVARVVQQSCREHDLAVRYGGEEFLLALIGVDAAAATVVADRLLTQVAAQPWADVAPGLQVTVSIGLAAAVEASDAQALFTLADRRLYAAKYGGRNQRVAVG